MLVGGMTIVVSRAAAELAIRHLRAGAWRPGLVNTTIWLDVLLEDARLALPKLEACRETNIKPKTSKTIFGFTLDPVAELIEALEQGVEAALKNQDAKGESYE